MNKQIEKKCKDCLHYEVCRFVNALAVANVVNAENCRMFKNAKGYRKSTDVAMEIFAEIDKIIVLQIHKCEVFRDKEFDRSDKKYFEGGEWSLRQISYWIAELKKKYESEVSK